MQLMRVPEYTCTGTCVYIAQGISLDVLPTEKRNFSTPHRLTTTTTTERISGEERVRLGFTTREWARKEDGIYEKGDGEEEGVRWKIPICSRGPAGSISSSVALFGFLDDITLGDGNNARFDRAFVDE